MNKKQSFRDILFSSKTQEMFIELNNYSYFHSPSNLDDEDPRLIGRENEENELKRILLNSDTPSGTYLVTGFRGIGKTSLVSKVLAEIKGQPIFRFGRMIIIFLLALIPVIFNFYRNEVFIAIIVVANLGAILHLLKKFLRKDDLKLTTLFNVFGRFRTFNNDLTDYSQLIIKISITSIVIWMVNFKYPISLNSISIIFGVYIFIFFITSSFKSIHNSRKKISFNSLIIVFNHTFGFVSSLLSKSIRGSNLQCIHLNLGKDNINEKDVMKQILQALYHSYRDNFKVLKINRILWILIIGFGIVICQYIYFYRPVFKGINTLKYELGIYEYLPSQKIFILDSLDTEKYDNKFSQVEDVNAFKRNIDTLLYYDNACGYVSFFESTSLEKSLLKKVFNQLDFVIFKIYFSLRSPLNSLIGSNNSYPTKVEILMDKDGENVSPYYSVIPHYLDYTQWLYILILVIIIYLGGLYRWFGVNTNAYILRRLTLLKDRLDAEVFVQQNNTGQIKGRQFFQMSFSKGRSKRYPLADYGIIEAELINIFKDISKIPVILSRPRFIFVFDELDKIEPYANQNLKDKEAAENVDSSEFPTSYASTESHRNRQQMVSKLLATLKFFFNTVEAKFIFIAGREMFDASLADTSDRESFIGSIFNKVIYINSFYTDVSDDKPTDISSMTEAYVCQFLERSQKTKYADLESYYEALKSKLKIRINDHRYSLNLTAFDFQNDDEYQLYADFKNKLYAKVLYTLQNFITYLTYRSNGSPKKITQLFEEFISDSIDRNITNSLVIGKRFNRISGLNEDFWINKPRGFYLKFTENDQYKFALTASLFTPFVNSRGRYLKRLGDKLLVSTSFLMDHLYKYHKSAFSWHNLELTPEIIAINKAPELRDFIENIVGYLAKTNFREIISGIHDFKFQNRIRGEINYISKISEMEAAAFNFTLDESLQIKRHYQKKLQEERDVSAKYQLKIQDQYVHSTGMYNMMIGDLYFYDEEFDEAIRYYKNAIQELRYIVTDRSTTKQIYLLGLYLKNSMKLALTFEKQHSYDRAYSTYNRISHEIVRNRDVDINSLFGIKETTLYFKDVKKFIDEIIDPKVIFNGFVFNNSTKNLAEEIPMLLKHTKENIKHLKPENKEEGNEIKKIIICDLKNFFKKRIGKFSGWDIECKGVEYLEQHVSDLYESDEQDLKLIATFLLNSRFRNESDFIDIIIDDPEEYQKSSYNKEFKSNKRFEFFSFHDNLYTVVKSHFSYSIERHEIDLMRNFYENLRLAYQPIVAKLAMLEKKALHGINYSDLQETDNEMYFLMKPMPNLERGLLLSEYLNRVGDILYFKNGQVLFSSLSGNGNQLSSLNDSIQVFDESIFENKKTPYIKNILIDRLDLINLFNIDLDPKIGQNYNAPFSAFEYYFRSLVSLMTSYCPEYGESEKFKSQLKFKNEVKNVLYGQFFHKGESYTIRENGILENLLKIIISGIYPNNNILGRDDILKSFAAILADIGDSYYSMASVNNKLPDHGFLQLFDFDQEPLHGLSAFSNLETIADNDALKIKAIVNYSDINDHLHKAVVYYFLSYLFLNKAGNYRNAADKLLRILTIYSECDADNRAKLGSNKSNIYASLKNIYFKASLMIHKSFDNTIRPEKLRYAFLTNIFYTQAWDETSINAYNQDEDKKSTQKYLSRLYIKHSSINAYLKDLYIIMAKIVLDLNLITDVYNTNEKKEALLKMKRQFINPFNTNSSNFTRVFELTLAIKLNFRIAFESNLLVKGDFVYNTSLSNVEDAVKMAKFCIDSAYCANAILEITYLSGHSYLVFNTITGTAHKWLGDWCRWLKSTLRVLEECEEFEKINEVLYKLKTELNELKGIDKFINDYYKLNALDLYILDSSYQYEKASERFNLAVQTHNEGKEYKNFISNLYYLEDDFNDELIHFYAARERFMINSGAITQSLKEISFHLKGSETNNLNVIFKDYIVDNH